MKQYPQGDMAQIAKKLVYCVYSIWMFNQIRTQAGNVKDAAARNDHWVTERILYYQDNFFIHLADVLSYFYKADDKELFDKLKLSPDDLKGLQKLRGVTAHIKDHEEALKTWLETLQNPNTKELFYKFMIVRDHFYGIYKTQYSIDAKYFYDRCNEIDKHFQGD